MKQRLLTAVLSLTVLLQLAFPAAVLAQTASAQACNKSSGAFLQIPTWYQYLTLDADCSVKEFAFRADVFKVAVALLDILLYFAGVVAFCFTVWAGFKFVLSRGNPTEAAKARQAVIDAVIGLVIAISAAAIVGFFGEQLKK